MGKNKKKGGNKNVKSPVKPEDNVNKAIQGDTERSFTEKSKLETSVTTKKIESTSNDGTLRIEETSSSGFRKEESMMSNKTSYSKTITFKNGELISGTSPDTLIESKIKSGLKDDDFLKLMNSDNISDNSLIHISKKSSKNVRITKSSTKLCSKSGPSPSIYFKWNPTDLMKENLISFYNEIKVTETAQWTHFCPIGWNEGYMGLLDGHSKRIIMCLWNQIGENDVEVIRTSDSVQISKFQHEGSGLCASFEFNWDLNTKYSFLLNCSNDGPKTIYSGYFYDINTKNWINFASLKVTPKRNGFITGMYSYIEDYMCSGAPRAGCLGGTWFKSEKGTWAMADEVKINNTFTSNIPMSRAHIEEHEIAFSLGLGVNHIKENILRPSTTDRPDILLSVPPAL